MAAAPTVVVLAVVLVAVGPVAGQAVEQPVDLPIRHKAPNLKWSRMIKLFQILLAKRLC